jgi:tetratricopeptide (TPR) repeat protein
MYSFMKIVALFALLSLFACKGDPKVERDRYYTSAEQYLKNGRYEEAIIQFRNALTLDPGHVPSYLGSAKAFQRLDNHQNALAAFQKVVDLDSKNVEARLQLGGYFLTGGLRNPEFFKRAQHVAEEVLVLEPSNIDARILLGNAYAGLNDLERSAREIKQALSSDPTSLSAALNMGAVQLRQRDVGKAELTFKEALQNHPNEIKALLAMASFYLATDRKPEAEVYFKRAFDLAPADTSSLYGLVGFYMSMNRELDAENTFKEAIAKKPEAREPRWGLANLYLYKKNMEEGLQGLRELVKRNPNDRQAEIRIAELYLGMKNVEDAEKLVRSLLDRNKNDAEGHYLYGKIFRVRNQDEKALEEFEAAIKLRDWLLPPYVEKAAQTTLSEVLRRDKNHLAARGALAKVLALRQKPQDALQEAQQVLEAMPNNEDALAARAEAFRSLGRMSEAKEDFRKLCEIRPDYPIYWHRLGLVEAAQGDTAGALEHFRKAVALKADFSAAINDILYVYLKSNKFDDALSELDRLSKLSSPRDEIHVFRGRIYLAKENYQEAEREFRRATQINPQNYQAYIFLGQLNLQRNNIQQALKEVDQLIAKNDKFAPAYLVKAYYLQVAKDVAGSIANYRKTIQLDPQNVVAANNLAWMLCENNTNLEEALSLAQAARKRAPDNPEIADTLGWIYYKQKNYVLAADQLLFSVNNRQAQAEHYYRLGMALYGKGDVRMAKQTLRRALEMNASFSGSDEAREILKQSG